MIRFDDSCIVANFGSKANIVVPQVIQVANSGYQYQYNGKEWQDELGYNMYDMDMRQYEPAIARWIVQDPIVHHGMSPYNAFDDNPVFWADPNGASPIYNKQIGQYVINGEVVDFQRALDYANAGGNADGKNNNVPDGMGINVIAIAKGSLVHDSNLNKIDDIQEYATIGASKTSAKYFIFESLDDFASKLEIAVGKGNYLSNLIIVAHDGYKHSSINANGGGIIYYENQFKKLGEIIGGYVNKDFGATIALEVCNIGYGAQPEISSGNMHALSNSSGATVFSPMTWGRVSTNLFNTDGGSIFYPIANRIPTSHKKDSDSTPNSVSNLGNWGMYLPNLNNYLIVTNIYFTSTGLIRN